MMRRASISHSLNHRQCRSTDRNDVNARLLSSLFQRLIDSLLEIMERHHIRFPDKGIVHIGHEIDGTFLLHKAERRRFVTTELEVLVNGRDAFFRCRIALDPAGEGRAAVAFAAGCGNDHDTALFHSVLRVIDGFLCLIEIDILRIAASRNNDDVSRFLDIHSVEAIQETAGVTMRCDGISGCGIGDLLMIIQDYIHDEIGRAVRCRFFDVLAHRISIEMPCIRTGADHISVIRLDRGKRSAARHDGFHAAGITGKVVVLDIAEKDAAVGFGNRAEDIDGGPIPAGAKMHAVFRIAVDAFHFVIRPFTGKALSLLFCQMAMGTQCKDDGDIFLADARSFQLLQDTGDQKPGRHGARNVARDDNDLSPAFTISERRAEEIG